MLRRTVIGDTCCCLTCFWQMVFTSAAVSSWNLTSTVAHNCQFKYKLLTSNTKSWHQIQITHIKNKLLTSNTDYSHQIQNPDIKHKLLTSNTNCSHQIQITHIKYKILTLKNKIKRSAVGDRKLCPVFTRPWSDRHFAPAHGIVVGMFCSTCGRNVDNCNFCSNCGKGKLKL